jgi:hypothetical protein
LFTNSKIRNKMKVFRVVGGGTWASGHRWFVCVRCVCVCGRGAHWFSQDLRCSTTIHTIPADPASPFSLKRCH